MSDYDYSSGSSDYDYISRGEARGDHLQRHRALKGRVSLSAENRKNLIADLEAKGILDVES